MNTKTVFISIQVSGGPGTEETPQAVLIEDDKRALEHLDLTVIEITVSMKNGKFSKTRSCQRALTLVGFMLQS